MSRGLACLDFVMTASQLLGFDVDPVLSVQFSNHTGFPTIAGEDRSLMRQDRGSLLPTLLLQKRFDEPTCINTTHRL